MILEVQSLYQVNVTYAVSIIPWGQKFVVRFMLLKPHISQLFHIVLQLEELKKSHMAGTSRETIDDESPKDDEASIQTNFT